MRVFISYTHDSQEHKDRVWELSVALRNDGIDCTIDEHVFSPSEGWPRWTRDQIHESQFVLVVATETYKRRYEGKEEPGKGLGAKWEGFVITQELYETEGRNDKFIPVVFSREDAYHIPLELRGATYYDLSVPDRYDKLFRHLTNKPERVVPPVAPRIRPMPQLETQSGIRFRPQLARKRQLPEPPTQIQSNTGSLMVNIFDGTRQPIAAGTQVLLTVIDGNQKQLIRDYFPVPKKFDVPIYDNYGDNYTVLASATGYKDAGFTPIKMVAGAEESVDLMLMPNNASFNFRDALWPTLKQTDPNFAVFLAQGAANDAAAETRYTQLMEMQPGSLASFLNLATAMTAITLPKGTPLDYIKGVIWDNTFAQDRFFGWADPELIAQIIAVTPKVFRPELDPSIFHDTATRSWKQIQFGEASVRLTFHEGEEKEIHGKNCVMIEPDFSYYKDLAAHFLLEVAVNGLTHSLTDPKQVYVLCWMAGRHARGPEFNPPYLIV